MAAVAHIEQQRVVALARGGCRAAASAAARPATARCSAAAPAGGAAESVPRRRMTRCVEAGEKMNDPMSCQE